MFQTRYVPFGLLSNKPLGTFFTMLPMLVFVNKKVIISTYFFTRFYSCKMNSLRVRVGELAVDKPRTRQFVFELGRVESHVSLNLGFYESISSPTSFGVVVILIPALAVQPKPLSGDTHAKVAADRQR